MKILFHLILALFAVSCTANSASQLTVEQKAIIHLILSQTSELNIHRMRGATENRVYVHKDGHKEAVYDANGKLVQDGINDGSYNYEHPENNPFGHYIKDIEPWLRWGASPNDPTTIPERTYAYMGDLEGGIRDAREMWPEISTENYTKALQQSDFPKTWVKILKQPGTHDLFSLVKGDLEYTDDNVIKTMKALNAAFDDVY